jgi:hypothetical protein
MFGYYAVKYEGKEILRIFAGSMRGAKTRAVRTLVEEGRRDLKVAYLEIEKIQPVRTRTKR